MEQQKITLNHDFTPKFKDFILKMFQNIDHNDIEYIYRGEVTSETVAYTLELARYNLEKTVDLPPIRKRIYFIMGEGLQNITKHQDLPEEEELKRNNLIVFSKHNDVFNITTANIIRNENIPPLKNKLERINELSVEELRELARYIRKNTVLSDQSNANIGLVEIAKRSGSKLLFEFRKINEQYSYFYLNIKIHLKTIYVSDKLFDQDFQYIKYIIKFHDYLNEINTKLIFKGDFSQENILSLLETLRHQVPENTTTIKVNNIMIEMLQNIEKHGDNLHNIKEWKPGFFMINFLNNKFYLTSANYIENQKIPALKDKLIMLNQMDKKQLTDLYRRVLLEETVSSRKTGLGFIDMRRRSSNPFNFSFLPINEKISLLIFQVIVNNT